MLSLYTETTLQVKPSTPASVIQLQIPRLDGSYQKPRFSETGSLAERSHAKDEKGFAKQNLTSQSSLYFRQTKSYPRSFVWRVIGNERVLQVQCADLARSATDQKEAHLTLAFEFQDPILPSCVAVSDADEGDVLYIFTVTYGERRELHSLTIPTNYFRNPANIEKDAQKWCKTCQPSSVYGHTPHLMHANNPFELFLTFSSGRLQRLRRTAEQVDWTTSDYDDRRWGSSVRSVVAWGTMRSLEYGSSTFDLLTVHGLVVSPTHIFTLCLNHTLRVWNSESGKVVVTKDLLDKQRGPQDHVQISPAEKSFIRLVKSDMMSHPVLVTYSPLDGGQFKFWDVRGGLTTPLVIEDKYPGIKLRVPDPDPTGNTVWSLIGVEVSPGDNLRQSEMWVLYRNNNYHHLYSVHFDFTSLPENWESNWVRTSPSSLGKSTPPDLVKSDAQDSTRKWLDFLFFPGRYPPTVLHTALSIYENAISAPSTGSKKYKPLQERLVFTIAANVTLRKYSEGDMDYERFSVDTDHQWRNFWRIVETINDGRQAPISLALDVFGGMAWIAMADLCCAVRECSTTELLLQNETSELQACEDLATERWPHRKMDRESNVPIEIMAGLIAIAILFRKSFSPELSRDVDDALEEELMHDAEYPVPQRLNDFYERANFADSISIETFNQVETDMNSIGGFAALTNLLFEAVLDTLPQQGNGERSLLRTTIFGSHVLSAGMQDTITTSRQVVLDLLLLVVFLNGEMSGDEASVPNFDAARLFVQLAGLLKEYEKNCWLLSHSRLVPLEFLGPQPAPNTQRQNISVTPNEGRCVTIMEDAVAKAIRPRAADEIPLNFLLTDLLGLSESWINGKDEISPDDGIVYIQCDLIAQKNIDLASDFLRFQPGTAWATYVRGRLYVARSDYDVAAKYFQKAAFTLACGRAVGKLSEMSAGLLSMMDVECFNNGLPRYFQHVLGVFEDAGAYSQMASFARLALQALLPVQKEPVHNFKSELLSRLFTAELKASRYLAAFESLIQFTDQALQKKSMISLLTSVLDPKAASMNGVGAVQLLHHLPLHLYPHLAHHVDQHLASHARKQSSIPDRSLHWSTQADVDYLKILHTLRVAQGDYRGALSVLLDRVRLTRKSSKARSDAQATDLRRALLSLINAMTCVAPDEAYILTEVEEKVRVGRHNGIGHEIDVDGGDELNLPVLHKRVILTLDDVRREYQQVLDRCSRIERGDFDFGMDGESDDEDDDWNDAVRANAQVNGVGGDAMEG